jgi:hypothetical protein
MSLWGKLPTSIIQEIYEYDLTYKEKLDECLSFIEHACPSCSCDGGEKNRYRHYGSDENIFDAFWNWEWRRRNACLKHNPGDFDKNGNQTKYNWFDEMRLEQIETIINNNYNIYFNYEIRTGRVWFNGLIVYNLIMALWMFCTCNKDIYSSPINNYSKKKLTGTRFMDMAHNQRPIVA